MTSTVAVQLTGAGRGAVASVLVDGPNAIEYIHRFFRTIEALKPRLVADKTYFGRWTWQDYDEELVVCRTGLQQIEIHCHGGRLASRKIIDSLIEAGADELPMEEWLRISEPDRYLREAKSVLPKIKTERAFCVVLDQLRGAMRRHLQQIADSLHNRDQQAARVGVQRLIERGELGVRLQRPLSVVLIGPPNSGKSSLINAIVGFQRAVVFDQPGTTRDLVTVDTAIDGWPFVFTDTAGLRDSADPIEQEGIRLAKQTLTDADLVLRVRDLTVDADEAVVTGGKVTLQVGTKADLVTSNDAHVDVLTSSETGEGVSQLIDLIAKTLIPTPPESGSAVPLSRELVASLEALRDLIDKGDFVTADQMVVELLTTDRS